MASKAAEQDFRSLGAAPRKLPPPELLDPREESIIAGMRRAGRTDGRMREALAAVEYRPNGTVPLEPIAPLIRILKRSLRLERSPVKRPNRSTPSGGGR